MPIGHLKRGNNTFTEAHFGTGDLLTAVGKEQDSDVENLLLIMEQEQTREIGTESKTAGLTTDEIPMVGEPLALRFTSSASARVVVDYLLQIEQNLIVAGQ